MAKQKAKVESSICEAYLCRETSHFCLYYFAKDVLSLRNRVNRYDDGGVWPGLPTLSVFDYPGRAARKPTVRWLRDDEMKAAKLCVLLTCEEIQQTLRYT